MKKMMILLPLMLSSCAPFSGASALSGFSLRSHQSDCCDQLSEEGKKEVTRSIIVEIERRRLNG